MGLSGAAVAAGVSVGLSGAAVGLADTAAEGLAPQPFGELPYSAPEAEYLPGSPPVSHSPLKWKRPSMNHSAYRLHQKPVPLPTERPPQRQTICLPQITYSVFCFSFVTPFSFSLLLLSQN